MAVRSDLIRRANELSDRADREDDIDVKGRLRQMATHYARIAESEAWLAFYPTTIVSIGDISQKNKIGGRCSPADVRINGGRLSQYANCDTHDI